MPGIVITFLVIAVVLGVGMVLLANVKDSQCVDAGGSYNATIDFCHNSSGQGVYSYALNGTEQGMLGIDKIATWQPTLAIIVVAAVVIGVIGYFYVAGKR